MNQNQIAVIQECSERSIAGDISFPKVVQKLQEIGVESYHADLYQKEKTYYFPNGESHVKAEQFPADTIASEFSEAGIREALSKIQTGKIQYLEFVRLIMAAGATNYVVYIVGKRAIYLGRKGEFHVELFPTAK